MRRKADNSQIETALALTHTNVGQFGNRRYD